MTKKSGNILVVDDNEDLLLAARLFLKQHFSVVHTEQDPVKIPVLMNNENYDVILLDMNFTMDATSGVEGFMWLDKILQLDPSAVVILITAFGDVEMAVKAVKSGATDFVLKPWQNEKLLATLHSALRLRQSRLEVDRLLSRQKQMSDDIDKKYHNMIGSSPAMLRVFKTIEKVAATDANVLILGENGTGKELIARRLHALSSRAQQVFLAVDMGAISESLFESELFGHQKGAFTGANEDRLGRFQAADGGTLFLDEIGNLPLHLQAKLLSALEQRKVTPVGADSPQPFDIRVIAATNTPIEHLRDADLFRPDLLFRLNTVEITIPPLRKRRDDILPIACHYAKVYAKKYGKAARSFSPPAETALLDYDWPGNVRALRHAVERAVILTGGNRIEPGDLQLDYPGEAAAPAAPTAIPTGPPQSSTFRSRYSPTSTFFRAACST